MAFDRAQMTAVKPLPMTKLAVENVCAKQMKEARAAVEELSYQVNYTSLHVVARRCMSLQVVTGRYTWLRFQHPHHSSAPPTAPPPYHRTNRTTPPARGDEGGEAAQDRQLSTTARPRRRGPRAAADEPHHDPNPRQRAQRIGYDGGRDHGGGG